MDKKYIYIGIGIAVIALIFIIYNFTNKSLQLKQAEIEAGRSNNSSGSNSLGGIFDIVNMAAGAIGTAIGSSKKAKEAEKEK